MRYLFKQSVGLCGKDYPKGTHEVPETAEKHPHFAHYLNAGYIVSLETKSERVEPVSEVSDGVVSKVDEVGDAAEVTLNDGAVAEAPKKKRTRK